MGDARHAIHTFDIDNYLNYIIPRPPWRFLPQPVTYIFGYRKPSTTDKQPPPTSALTNWFFSWIGAFIGIAIIENVFRALPLLGGHQSPLVIASFGAAAILEYNAISSPLSQPRNLIFGHFLAAAIGVGITKLFHLLPPARFETLRWLPGALAVGTASTVMSITKTVHPPAGATALLAASTPEITELGWWLLPLVLLAASLMLASSMLINNIYARFPVFWWTPADLSKFKFGRDDGDVQHVKEADVEKGKRDSASSASGEEREHENKLHRDPELRVVVEKDRIVIPDWMNLSQWEVEVLEGFQTKLRDVRSKSE